MPQVSDSVAESGGTVNRATERGREWCGCCRDGKYWAIKAGDSILDMMSLRYREDKQGKRQQRDRQE